MRTLLEGVLKVIGICFLCLAGVGVLFLRDYIKYEYGRWGIPLFLGLIILGLGAFFLGRTSAIGRRASRPRK